VTAELTHCPTCRSTCRSTHPRPHTATLRGLWDDYCYNPWHRGLVVHFTRTPFSTPNTAVCDAKIDDPRLQLTKSWTFVSCPRCISTAPTCDRSHPAPSCADPACYRAEAARKAAESLPSPGLRNQDKRDPDTINGAYEIAPRTRGDDNVPSIAEDFGGGETKVHYLPNEPKAPARSTSSFTEPDPTPAPLPPTPSAPHEISCPLCTQGPTVQDLPEITAWSCGHEILKRPRSIAALFQDMLRSAYQAGVASATTGETFEAWYQREVLR